jgi:hypothetical protein
MAEDFTAIEKRPESFRLNFADFGVVYKTTFKKGTITDFKKLTDDPLTVASLVKVDIDGQVSDYIPLFYTPKKLYWDDPDHQAQDFNKDNLYYENAWMSFQADDEVKVGFKEGTPVAVLGFADDTPRIGEDIFKINYQTILGVANEYYLQCSKQGFYGDTLGPDGKDLKLVESCYQLCSVEDYLPAPPTVNTQDRWLKYQEWLLTIGAIVYIFQVFGFRSELNGFGQPLNPPVAYIRANILAAPSTKDIITDCKAEGVINSAIVNPQLLDTGMAPWPDYGDLGFIRQTDFSSALGTMDTPTISGIPCDYRTIEIYQRPHTKAELQAAGMWPGNS